MKLNTAVVLVVVEERLVYVAICGVGVGDFDGVTVGVGLQATILVFIVLCPLPLRTLQ